METMTKTEIRWMIRGDMKRVCAIEYEAFEFPWLEEDFQKCLRQRNCIGMVAESGGRILGYMVYELHKTRLEILDFAVGAEFRGQGIGRQLMDKLKTKLSQQRRTGLLAHVSEWNLEGQKFFAAMGFKATNVERGYFEINGEDAYRMVFELGEL